MALENATYISELVQSNPTSTDPVGQGDDHVRLIKSVLAASFGGIDGAVLNSLGNPASAQDFKDLFDAVDALGSAGGSTPIGGIILWSGALDAVPAGWALCDGLNGTPNLEDRFVVGAGGLFAQGSSGGSSTTDNGGGGSGTATLNLPDHIITADNLPEHSHKMFSADVAAISGSDPAIVGQNSPVAARLTNNNGPYAYSQAAATAEATLGDTSDSGGVPSVLPLTHPSTDITIDGIEHTHTYAPPYYALAYIMRTA